MKRVKRSGETSEPCGAPMENILTAVQEGQDPEDQMRTNLSTCGPQRVLHFDCTAGPEADAWHVLVFYLELKLYPDKNMLRFQLKINIYILYNRTCWSFYFILEPVSLMGWCPSGRNESLKKYCVHVVLEKWHEHQEINKSSKATWVESNFLRLLLSVYFVVHHLCGDTRISRSLNTLGSVYFPWGEVAEF